MKTQEFNIIGKSIPRFDARAKVTGQILYPGDLNVPGMLYMKILFAERPHARIRSIDTSQAKESPGVVAVFTAEDVPVNEYGLNIYDQPVLCGPGSAKPGADVVRFVGDQVALVVAETEEAAVTGRDLIRVDYEDLPVVTDTVAAMQAGSPLIHPELGNSNIYAHYKIRKGDLDPAFKQADVIVESEYRLPFQEHAFLQPEAGLAFIDEEGRITIKVAGQTAHSDREGIAHALDLHPDQVRVIYPAIGGAFGGREDISIQIVLSLAAWKLRRPVKITWSRRESIIGHCKRHPVKMKARWGATNEGKLLAAEMEIIADGGAYLYTSNNILGNATIVCTGPYFIPNVKVDTYIVFTNNIPTGAFRGFGGPQANFLAEMQMDKLAQILGIDSVEMRMRNVLHEGDTLGVGTAPPLPINAEIVIETAVRRAGWTRDLTGWHAPKTSQPKESYLKHGIGMAAGFKNLGFSFGSQDNCWVRIELHGSSEIERVVLWQAAAEVGQGTHTVLIQMAAEALGVPVERVTLMTSDTATMCDSGSVSASRMTFMAGKAIQGAAQVVLEEWRAEKRPAVAEFKYLAPPTTPFEKETGHSMPNYAYGYAAQAVEVSVDIETGQVKVIQTIAADDVGQAINPCMVEGQIEGAIVQAHGYALLEDFQMKNGRVLTDHFSTYLIPTVLDVPEKVEPILINVPDPLAPWGARGIGEPPFLPFAPAVLAAIHDAVGIWLDEIPATPEKVLFALNAIQPLKKES